MTIVLPIIIIAGVGAVGAVVLVVFSEFFSVPKDEKAEQLESVLPGANCGACGFAGCSDYANAIASGTSDKLNLCTPGGNSVAALLGDIMGLTVDAVEAKKAVIRCQGNYNNTADKYLYSGVISCEACSTLFGGRSICGYGCLGYGDCKVVCKFNAIVVDNGLATVDMEKCTGCGACIEACPKKIISLVSENNKPVVLCANKDRGNITRKACSAGCIGCMKCTKVCPTSEKSVSVKDNNASIDHDLCIGCGKCTEACPVSCISKSIKRQ